MGKGIWKKTVRVASLYHEEGYHEKRWGCVICSFKLKEENLIMQK